MTASVLPLRRPQPQLIADLAAAAVHGDSESVRRPLVAGLIMSVALIAAVVVWASTFRLSGAVIANGVVVVASDSKKIQHPQGGVVGVIRVSNGSRVDAGDLLVRLDDTQTRASLGVISSQLVELNGRKVRLAADRDKLDDLVFPTDFAALSDNAERVALGERKLFQAQRTSAAGQKAQLAERIKQYTDERSGLKLQNDAKTRELSLVHEELLRVQDLYKRNLLPVTRVLSLQREEVRIQGEVGTLVAQIARLGGQISETRLQIIAVDDTKFSDAQKELRDVEGRISELQERRIAAEDQLRRVDIRAPIDGIVHELSVHTIGGVVNPAEQLMLLVPSADVLIVEVRVPSSEIEQITVGQSSMLRFPAFNQRTTPEINGTIVKLSPDAVRDTQSGQLFYVARIAPDAADITKLGEHKLIPGMPAEAFVQTTARTALSYLTKPLTDQFRRAFRER